MRDDDEQKIVDEVHEEDVTEEIENEDTSNDVEEKLAECEEKYKRALADYRNLEKRNQEQRGEWIRTANKEMLLRILPVLDTLMLALSHEDNQTIAVSIGQFLDVLKAEGVTRIETVGKKFDPHVMECLEKVDEGEMVLEEIRAGYMLYDKLLRPAQVKVGKKKN